MITTSLKLRALADQLAAAGRGLSAREVVSLARDLIDAAYKWRGQERALDEMVADAIQDTRLLDAAEDGGKVIVLPCDVQPPRFRRIKS
jgi:hypothetical protein